jgi:hypothetical protein
MSENWRPDRLPSWQAEWPFDPPGFTLLGRAVEQVGKAVYGNEWCGFEMSFGPYRRPSIPDYRRGFCSSEEARTVYQLVAEHRPDIRLPELPDALPLRLPISIPHSTSAPPPPPSIARPGAIRPSATPNLASISHTITTDLVFAAAGIVQSLAAAYEVKCEPLAKRRAFVEETMARHALWGNLRSGWLTSFDGSIRPMQDSFWNLSCWRSFFRLLKIDWQEPWRTGQKPDYLAWIYIRTDDLAEVVSTLAQAREQVERGQNPRPQIWPKDDEESVKDWLRRAEPEASRRCPPPARKRAYVATLEGIWRESDVPSPAAGTIARTIRASGGYPDGYID